MRVKVHLRVARDGRRPSRPKVAATVRPSTAPLYDGAGDPLPTVGFAVVLEVPDGMFAQAERVIATLTVPESAATINADVTPHEEAAA